MVAGDRAGGGRGADSLADQRQTDQSRGCRAELKSATQWTRVVSDPVFGVLSKSVRVENWLVGNRQVYTPRPHFVRSSRLILFLGSKWAGNKYIGEVRELSRTGWELYVA